MKLNIFILLAINLALCGADSEDDGFLPEEALRTAVRLAHTRESQLHLAGNTRLAVEPSSRHADLRVVPTAAEGESSMDQIKLGLPPALLHSIPGPATAVLADKIGGAVRTSLDFTGATSRRNGARLHVGEKFRRTSTESLEQPGSSRAAARAAAAERLSVKHSALKAFKAERQDAEIGPTEGGEAGHPARLDKKIQAYHGVLGKAVMVLALLAAGAICGGIGGVIYCWRRDANLVDPKDKALSQEARAKGKNFGRSTPQYGSYGASRGRR